MAKGLGAIMALGAMARDAAAIARLEKPACPLCGGPLESDGAGWFCYNQKPEHQCPKIGMAGLAFRKNGEGYADEFQGQTLAAIVEDGELIVRLSTVRGPYGKTNLRLWSEMPDSEIPAFVAGKEWVWQDWMEDFDKIAVKPKGEW